MVELIKTIVVSILLLSAGTYGVLWTLKHVKNDVIQAGAIAVYGLSAVAIIATFLMEVALYAL